jgi:hypothetical protein
MLTVIYALNGIRTHDPSILASDERSGLLLRSHYNQQKFYTQLKLKLNWLIKLVLFSVTNYQQYLTIVN